MTDKNQQPIEIDESDLEAVNGGLPAVQKVREAAARMSSSSTASTASASSASVAAKKGLAGDGSV